MKLKGLSLIFLVLFILVCARTSDKLGEITVKDLKGWLETEKKNFILIDVRTPEEHSRGYIPGTEWNIDYRELRDRIAETGASKEDTIVLYCRTGRRSGIGAETLSQMGFKNVFNLKGSMDEWRKEGFPIEKEQR